MEYSGTCITQPHWVMKNSLLLVWCWIAGCWIIKVSLYGENKWLVPENLGWFRQMLVYRDARLGRFHCLTFIIVAFSQKISLTSHEICTYIRIWRITSIFISYPHTQKNVGMHVHMNVVQWLDEMQATVQ